MNFFRSFCEEGGHVRESMCLIYRAVWQEKHLEDPQASLLTDESNGHLPGWHKPHYFQWKLTVRMSKKVVCCLGLFAGSEKWAHFFLESVLYINGGSGATAGARLHHMVKEKCEAFMMTRLSERAGCMFMFVICSLRFDGSYRYVASYRKTQLSILHEETCVGIRWAANLKQQFQLHL